MEEPIKMPEPCCASCYFGRYEILDTDGEDDEEQVPRKLFCTNGLSKRQLVDHTDYCFHHEYPF